MTEPADYPVRDGNGTTVVDHEGRIGLVPQDGAEGDNVIITREPDGVPKLDTGPAAATGGGGTEFLETPDEVDESDPTYFYFGWGNVDGGWLVQRQLRTTGASTRATTGYADLTTAWPNRTNLTYA